jgi:hypothetical protein
MRFYLKNWIDGPNSRFSITKDIHLVINQQSIKSLDDPQTISQGEEQL